MVDAKWVLSFLVVGHVCRARVAMVRACSGHIPREGVLRGGAFEKCGADERQVRGVGLLSIFDGSGSEGVPMR